MVDLQAYRKKIGELETSFKEASDNLVAARTRHEGAMAALKEEFDVDDLDGARALMERLDSNIAGLEESLKSEINEVKEALDVGAG